MKREVEGEKVRKAEAELAEDIKRGGEHPRVKRNGFWHNLKEALGIKD